MNIEKLFWTILKQKRNVSLLPGAILQMWGGAQIYQALVNSFLLIATAYNTTLREALHAYVPWLNFWMFFCILIFGNFTMMVIHFKFIQPSIQGFNATQGFKLINPSVDVLKKILERVEKIEKKLDGNANEEKLDEK